MNDSQRPYALSIAGLDPTGGAGIFEVAVVDRLKPGRQVRADTARERGGDHGKRD